MKYFILTILTIFLLPVHSYAQNKNAQTIEFTTLVNKTVERIIAQKLSDKLNDFYEEYSYMPYPFYSFTDINGDGINEIIVKFAEEFALRDQFDNVDTHIFLQTPQGLREIFYVQAFDIALENSQSNYKNIVITRKTRNSKMTQKYEWNGRDQYELIE
jgi:hypothetical protein